MTCCGTRQCCENLVAQFILSESHLAAREQKMGLCSWGKLPHLLGIQDSLSQGLEKFFVLEKLVCITPCDSHHLLSREVPNIVLDVFRHHEEPELVHRKCLRCKGHDKGCDLFRCKCWDALADKIRKEAYQLGTHKRFVSALPGRISTIHRAAPGGFLE